MATSDYTDTRLRSTANGGRRRAARRSPSFNPATGKAIGRVAHAGNADLDRALAAAQKGFETWRDMPADRARQDHAQGRRARCASAPATSPRVLTQEQGKPLAEAKGEALAAADIIEWFADEGLPRLRPHRAVARNLAARQMV